MDYTLCGCHPLPRDSLSIGKQLSRLVITLSRSKSREGDGEGGYDSYAGGRGGSFNTLKTFGKSAMLRPPPAPSTHPKTDESDSKKRYSGSKSELGTKGEVSGEVGSSESHPDVLAGSHPSDHDAVRYTSRTTKYKDNLILGMYEKRGKERMKVWEKAHSKSKSKSVKLSKSNEGGKKKKRDGEADGDGNDGHSSLGPHGYGYGIPPWGVFLFPVPIIFGNGGGGVGEGDDGADPNQTQAQGTLCVSVDASQVRMPGGCASVSRPLPSLRSQN